MSHKKNLYHFRDFRGTNYFCMPSFSRNTDANKELKSIRMQSVAPKGQNEITDIFPKSCFSERNNQSILEINTMFMYKHKWLRLSILI